MVLGRIDAYDMFGNRIVTTDALGNAIYKFYDSFGRVVAEWGATYPVRYAYDTQGRRTSLSTTRDGATWDETTWTYDPATSLCSSKTYADGSTVTYSYTPDNLLLRTTYASGRWKENVYDASRRLVSEAYGNASGSGGAGGPPAEVNTFAYDASSRTIAESNSVSSVTYQRDTYGICTNETITIAGGPQSSSSAEAHTIHRDFDAYGRLVRNGDTCFTYAPDGLLATVSNAEAFAEYAYTSDRLDAGYMLTLTNGTVFSRTVVRDAYRRSFVTAITNSVNGVPIETFAYDSQGRRVRKVTPTATHLYFYDGWHLVRETTVPSTLQPFNSSTDYVWGKDLSGTLQGAGGIGGLLYLTVSNSNSQLQLYIPFYDNNGNVSHYCDAQGTVVASYTYDAFGNIIAQSGPMADSFAHRFSTKYYDRETGLYYYGYRYYHPPLYRWINRDPIEEEGGINLFAFCGNNPYIRVDYSGLWALTIISEKTTDDDAKLWRKYDKESVIISNVRSTDEMFRIMEMLVRIHGGQQITRLNLSGHGLGGGCGIQFPTPPHFDITDLSFERKQQFRNLLARHASVYLWSCDSAKTETQCANLRNTARNMDITIVAKNSAVGSGPDIGVSLEDLASRVLAYFIKNVEANEWRVFRPQPSLNNGAKTSGPEARILKERRIK